MKRRGRGIACMWYPIGFTVAANPSAAWTVTLSATDVSTKLNLNVGTVTGFSVVSRGVSAEPLMDPRNCTPTVVIFARPYLSLAGAGVKGCKHCKHPCERAAFSVP